MRTLWIIPVMVLPALTGCGKPSSPGPAGPPEIKGKALDADGNPLTRVALTFLPQDEANKGTRVTCLTQKDGSFTGRCSAGRYKVTLAAVSSGPPQAPEKDKGKPAPPSPSLPPGVPARYGSEKDTPWAVDV